MKIRTRSHPRHFANVRFQSLLNDKFTLLIFFLFDDYFLQKQGNVSCFLTRASLTAPTRCQVRGFSLPCCVSCQLEVRPRGLMWLVLDLFLLHHIDVDPTSCDLSLCHTLIGVWIKAIHPICPLQTPGTFHHVSRKIQVFSFLQKI